MNLTISAVGVEFLRKKRGRRLQYRVGSLDFPQSRLQFPDPRVFVDRRGFAAVTTGGPARPGPGLILTHPVTQDFLCSRTISTARSRSSAGYFL